MGGPNSGRWFQDRTKRQTEVSRSLGISEFRDRLYPGSKGTVTWTRAGRVTAEISYFVTGDAGLPILTLLYRCQETDVRIPIRLQATYPAFGGVRWWFTCPLVTNGVTCHRRAGNLYLPTGARYFGCRHCHDLRSRSSQEEHIWERVAVALGFDAEVGASLNSRLRGNRLE